MGIYFTTYIEPPSRSDSSSHPNHYFYLSSKKWHSHSYSTLFGGLGDDNADTAQEFDEDSDYLQQEEEEEEERWMRYPFTSRRLTRRPRNITSTSTSTISQHYHRRSGNKRKRFITYGCRHCRTHLSSSLQIISKDYRGKTGDAYLISSVLNVLEDKIETRSMLTGDYLVCDIQCNLCHKVLGWKYLKSEHKEQRYKEGKYILEVETICRCD